MPVTSARIVGAEGGWYARMKSLMLVVNVEASVSISSDLRDTVMVLHHVVAILKKSTA